MEFDLLSQLSQHGNLQVHEKQILEKNPMYVINVVKPLHESAVIEIMKNHITGKAYKCSECTLYVNVYIRVKLLVCNWFVKAFHFTVVFKDLKN